MISPILIGTLCLAVPNQVNTDWLIDRYEESLGRIYSLRATVESRGSFDGGTTWRIMYITKLIRSGDRERDSVAIKSFPIDGALQDQINYPVSLHTPEYTRGLDGLDPDHESAGSASYIEHEATGKGPRVTGRISAPGVLGPHGYNGTPSSTALGFVVDPNQSLREMLQSSKKVVPIQGRDGKGDPTWILRLEPTQGNFTYSIHLNPKYNYMISACQVIGAGSEINLQVEEFQEPAPGIFIAKTTRRTIKRPEYKSPLLVEDKIEVADLNQPIPASDLRLEYPSGALIGDERDQTFNIWGDGKPALTFASKTEFNRWRMDQIAAAMKAKRRWLTEPVMITVAAGSTLLLVALLVYRRHLERKWHAAS
jgi:hypothetical protein